jgi:hypothetical protein
MSHDPYIIVRAGIVTLENISVAFILTVWANQVFSYWKDDMFIDQLERKVWVIG